MASYRRVSQPQRHGRSSLCFWGRAYPSRPLQPVVMAERPRAIKSAKSRKVPSPRKPRKERERSVIILKRLQKSRCARSAARSLQTKIPQDNSWISGRRWSVRRRSRVPPDGPRYCPPQPIWLKSLSHCRNLKNAKSACDAPALRNHGWEQCRG